MDEALTSLRQTQGVTQERAKIKIDDALRQNKKAFNVN